MSLFLIIIALIGAVFSAAIAFYGLHLAIPHGDLHASSTISVLGLMKVETTSVGLALAAIGIIGVVLTVRYVLKAFRDYLAAQPRRRP